MTKTRAYRFTVQPTPAQEEVLKQLKREGRFVWNRLVNAQRYAIKCLSNGGTDTLVDRLGAYMARKKITGMSCADFKHLPKAEKTAAVLEQRRKDLQEKVKFLNSAYSQRCFATDYAMEQANVLYGNGSLPMPSQAFHGLVGKFGDSSKLWHKFKAGQLRYKTWKSKIALQMQLQAIKGVIPEILKDGFVDMGRLEPAFKRLKISRHSGRVENSNRSLVTLPTHFPPGAVIKQVAIVIGNIRSAVVFFCDVPEAELTIDFKAAPGQVIGIDPGMRTPVTWSHIERDSPWGEVRPNARRTAKFLKKMRRVQRKLDRQRRANNPDCYNPDGTFIRGKRPKVISQNMRKNLSAVAQLSGTLADRRTESYRIAARMLLNRADTIHVGTWRPPRRKPVKGNNTKQQRGIKRAGLDAAICTFVNILKDYAKRSITPKTVEAIDERGTTYTCPDCGAPTGPRNNLTVRVWTCSKCGAVHRRDVASCRSIGMRQPLARAQRVKVKQGSTA